MYDIHHFELPQHFEVWMAAHVKSQHFNAQLGIAWHCQHLDLQG